MCNGFNVTKERYQNTTISRIKVTTEQGASIMNAPIGDYTDISFYNNEDNTFISEILTNELARIAELSPGDTVLIVGLGNSDIVTDSLGPATIGKLEMTRILNKMFPHDFSSIVKVCAINPGVIGKIGIEVQETVEMYVKNLKPNLIIVIDALDIHNIKQIGHTIMLTNTGLRQNSRIPVILTEQTLGVPVVTIGIPFVTDLVTMANDLIETLLPELIQVNGKSDITSIFTHIPSYDERLDIIKTSLLQSHIQNAVFIPENITKMIDCCSSIIAQGINKWLNVE